MTPKESPISQYTKYLVFEVTAFEAFVNKAKVYSVIARDGDAHLPFNPDYNEIQNA